MEIYIALLFEVIVKEATDDGCLASGVIPEKHHLDLCGCLILRTVSCFHNIMKYNLFLKYDSLFLGIMIQYLQATHYSKDYSISSI